MPIGFFDDGERAVLQSGDVESIKGLLAEKVKLIAGGGGTNLDPEVRSALLTYFLRYKTSLLAMGKHTLSPEEDGILAAVPSHEDVERILSAQEAKRTAELRKNAEAAGKVATKKNREKTKKSPPRRGGWKAEGNSNYYSCVGADGTRIDDSRRILEECGILEGADDDGTPRFIFKENDAVQAEVRGQLEAADTLLKRLYDPTDDVDIKETEVVLFAQEARQRSVVAHDVVRKFQGTFVFINEKKTGEDSDDEEELERVENLLVDAVKVNMEAQALWLEAQMKVVSFFEDKLRNEKDTKRCARVAKELARAISDQDKAAKYLTLAVDDLRAHDEGVAAADFRLIRSHFRRLKTKSNADEKKNVIQEIERRLLEEKTDRVEEVRSLIRFKEQQWETLYESKKDHDSKVERASSEVQESAQRAETARAWMVEELRLSEMYKEDVRRREPKTDVDDDNWNEFHKWVLESASARLKTMEQKRQRRPRERGRENGVEVVSQTRISKLDENILQAIATILSDLVEDDSFIQGITRIEHDYYDPNWYMKDWIKGGNYNNVQFSVGPESLVWEKEVASVAIRLYQRFLTRETAMDPKAVYDELDPIMRNLTPGDDEVEIYLDFTKESNKPVGVDGGAAPLTVDMLKTIFRAFVYYSSVLVEELRAAEEGENA